MISLLMNSGGGRDGENDGANTARDINHMRWMDFSASRHELATRTYKTDIHKGEHSCTE